MCTILQADALRLLLLVDIASMLLGVQTFAALPG